MDLVGSLRSLMLPVEFISENLPSKGQVYEIGSGHGSLAAQLAKLVPDRKVVALDKHLQRIEKASEIFNLSNLKFCYGDALKFSYDKMDGIVMSDFLHHLSFELQISLIQVLSTKIKKGGVMIIKEIDKDDGVRTVLSRIWDLVLYPRDKISYRTKGDWVELMEAFGFSVKSTRQVPWFPGSTFVFKCVKLN